MKLHFRPILTPRLLGYLAAVSLTTAAQATVFQFNLIGTGGPGLLASNQPGDGLGGSGGELESLGGITYDDVTMALMLNVGWGSDNGFTDLTSTLISAGIFGPMMIEGDDGFSVITGRLFSLTATTTLASGGQVLAASNPITLTIPQQADLYSGLYFLRLATVNNEAGETQGSLVMVPETSSSLLGLVSLSLLTLRRRRA